MDATVFCPIQANGKLEWALRRQLSAESYNQRIMENPLIGVVMGSRSDYEILQPAIEILNEFSVAHEARVVSAHRTPDWLFEYAASAEERGLRVLIAGAGGAAHLPGMLAAKTHLPVLGVPIPATMLAGVDSLLSIVQMPKGVPVGTLAIGKPGAANAALLAVSILALQDSELRDRLCAWREARKQAVLAQTLPAAKNSRQKKKPSSTKKSEGTKKSEAAETAE
jgi:5-(carboxyamino)imidazole ribonucleotide mutase